MGNAHVYDTVVDKWVRRTGETRRSLAEAARVSPSTLLKVRAQELRRGKSHWTSIVMVGIQMGVFTYGETVYEDDPRIRMLMRNPALISSKGSRARHWYG